MKLAKDIEKALAMAAGSAEVSALLSDGKPHELTMINAVFIDGFGLSSDAFNSFLMTRQVTASDFEAVFEDLTNRLVKTYSAVQEESMVLLRAAAVSGLNVTYLFVKMMQEKKQCDQEELMKHVRITGVIAGLLDHGYDLERDGFTLAGERLREIQEYLATAKYPDIGSVVGRKEGTSE